MDAKNITPRFEFGFGLSYTTFEYSDLSITDSGSSKVVSFKVTNTGSFAGAEKPQLYLGYPDGAGEPPKVLRGFDEVSLAIGTSLTVQMTLSQRDFRYGVLPNLTEGITQYLEFSAHGMRPASHTFARLAPSMFTLVHPSRTSD